MVATVTYCTHVLVFNLNLQLASLKVELDLKLLNFKLLSY